MVPQVRETLGCRDTGRAGGPGRSKPLLARQGHNIWGRDQEAKKTEIHAQFCPFLLCPLGPVSMPHRAVMRESI